MDVTDPFDPDQPVAVQPAATRDDSYEDLRYAYQGSHDALIHKLGAYRTTKVTWSTFSGSTRERGLAILEEGGYSTDDLASLRDWFATYPDGWLVIAMASHSTKMPKGVG